MPPDQPIVTAHDIRRTNRMNSWRIPEVAIAWLYLAMAIAAEVCGLAVLKICVSMRHVEGLVVLYLFVAISYIFLAKAVRTIPVGVAYAIWEGSGIALITLVSALAFQQVLTLREIVGLSMVVIGIWMIHAGESHDA